MLAMLFPPNSHHVRVDTEFTCLSVNMYSLNGAAFALNLIIEARHVAYFSLQNSSALSVSDAERDR